MGSSPRTPLVVLGAFISILGYAVVVNALSNLTAIFGGPVGILNGLIPGVDPHSGQPAPVNLKPGPPGTPTGRGGGPGGSSHGHKPQPMHHGHKPKHNVGHGTGHPRTGRA